MANDLFQGQQIKAYFKDGSSVICTVNSDNGEYISCSCLSANDHYKQGDTVILDKVTDHFEKLNSKDLDAYDIDELKEKIKELEKIENSQVKLDRISEIEKLIELKQKQGMKKTSQRFQYEFDKHKPQYRLNDKTGEIEKDVDNIRIIGRRIKRLAYKVKQLEKKSAMTKFKLMYDISNIILDWGIEQGVSLQGVDSVVNKIMSEMYNYINDNKILE